MFRLEQLEEIHPQEWFSNIKRNFILDLAPGGELWLGLAPVDKEKCFTVNRHVLLDTSGTHGRGFMRGSHVTLQLFSLQHKTSLRPSGSDMTVQNFMPGQSIQTLAGSWDDSDNSASATHMGDVV